MRTQPTKKKLVDEFLAKRNPLMGKATKKQIELRAQFDHLVRSYLKSKGARKGQYRDLEIDTAFGPLECSVHESSTKSGAWVACLFHELRPENWRPSRPSGKWNFHFDFNTEAEMRDAFNTFKHAVDQITR